MILTKHYLCIEIIFFIFFLYKSINIIIIFKKLKNPREFWKNHENLVFGFYIEKSVISKN